MNSTTKSLTLEMPVDLYRVTAQSARRRRMSLNSFIVKTLEVGQRPAEAKQVFDGFTKLGSHAKECDVEYAIPAQREVVGRDA